MSRTIDERVVEMRFDNKQFEANAATTMTTLQKLKKSLDFSKVGDSFENINKASNKVDLGGLDRAISGIHNKFSALEVMAITTLGNITNSIVNSAKRWMSAFTIDPIKTGFQEYETQINAVQTILANTQKEGTNIKVVNAALDELNAYADKTIYNFTEMTRNIGTFTAAGVDLKTSVGAIQGIANLAAVSGSTSQQASTAMYQLSQALSTGTLRLMDWNSVVNAGMGGQLFQDALKETSRLLGTGADAAIKAEGSFRESLQTGWLTSEVLTETLKKFTTSGAAEYVANYTGLSKDAIEAELELAKSTYGEADAINKAAEALAKKSGKNKDEIAETLRFAETAEDAATKVKTFTQLIDTMKEAVQSGWAQSFRTIVGDFEEAKELFTEISDSFGAVISASADARNKLLSEVFNKKDAQSYMASIVGVSKEAVEELQTVAKESGTASDAFKGSLNEFTKGDKILNNVITHLIRMTSSELDVVTYISGITGKNEDVVRRLQNIGKEFGYTSSEFKAFSNTLAEGDSEMKATITHLLEMSEAMQKPSGRELLIDSLRNGMKGLVSVIKPVQEAFRDVFPPTTADQVYGMLEAFHEFTKTLTLSEKNSQNLKKAFKGLFDISKLLGDGFFSLVKLILPIEKPIGTIGDGIFDLAGALGSFLSTISNGVRSNKILLNMFSLLEYGSHNAADGLSRLIKTGTTFINRLSKMEGTAKFIDSVNNAFERLHEKATPYINTFINETEELIDSLFNFEDINVDEILRNVSDALADLAFEIDQFSFKTVEKSFDKLKSRLKEFSDLLMSNNGISSFITNSKKYREELQEAFTWDNLLDRLEKIMTVFGKFFKWIKSTLAPAFEDISVGGVIAAGGGIGIVAALLKISNAFEHISKSFKVVDSIKGAFDGVKGTLIAYQKELKAEALLKVAGAIAILAAALVLLSFADTDRLMSASVALTLIAGTLMLGVTKMLEALNKGRQLNDSVRVLAKGFSSTMKKFGRALEIKAIGSTIKSFAQSIAIIAVSMIALGIMYKKDKDSLLAGVELVGIIGAAILAMMAVLAILSKLGNTKGIASIGTSILMISASFGLIILSLSKLMSMELPSDYRVKLNILGEIFTGLGAMALILGMVAGLAGGNQLPKMSSTIKSLTLLLLASVLSLKLLFDMDLPSDYKQKLGILAGIFAGFSVLILAMGAAARISKGQGLKAAGSILAMAAFLVVVVGSLFVLTLIPADKMLKGALALGGVLVALGVALAGAGQISDKNALKTVLSMTIMVGVITAALAVLSMIPFEKLLKSTASLGVILLSLALNFKALSKVQSKKAIPAALAMIAATLTIAYSLYTLSEQPWEGLLAASVAMSATLLAFSKSFEMILGKRWSENNVKKIWTFLFLTLAVIPIGAALSVLAKQPWDGLLFATVGLSATLLALTGCFAIVSKVKVNPMAIAAVVAGSASLILIAAGISMLTKYDGQQLLTSCLALSSVLLVMVGVMAACAALSSVATAAMLGVIQLGIVISEIAVVLAAIGALAQISGLKWLIEEGGDLLQGIGVAIGKFIGGIIGGVMGGVTSQLPQIGSDLSNFMTNIIPFITGIKMIDSSTLANVAYLTAIIVALTAAGFISGITSLFGLSLVSTATELSAFMVALLPFIMLSRDIKEDNMKACNYLAKMIVALTGAQILSGIGNFLGFSGSLVDFGKQLSEFGPYIKRFSNIVKDVKPEAVQGAASAAEIMATVAKKLPAQGGLVQKIFGEKNLAEFGRELVQFGPSIKQFAEQIKNVKPEAVQGAASAAEIMANLASKLPNSESLWNKIFGGGKVSLSDFGEELISFGNSMTAFSSSITGVTTDKISSVVTSFESLIALASKVQGTSAMGLVNFTNQLGQIGSDSVDKFVQAFTNSGPKVSSALTIFITNVKTGIQNKNEEFKLAGTLSANAWILGMSLKKGELSLLGSELANQVLGSLKVSEGMFLIQGSSASSQYLFGFRNRYPESNSTGRSLAIYALAGCQAIRPSFYNAGVSAGIGFVNGLRSQLGGAASAGREIANAAYEAAKRALDEHSPSKKMGEVGDFAGLGFVEQLLAHVANAYQAGEEIGEAAYKGTVSIISNINDFDINPTIRPRVDLGDVQRSVSDINRMFNESIAYTASLAQSASSSISTQRNNGVIQNGEAVSSSEKGNTYNFIQNNNSPKALSRIDIYRQTRNQFSQFKEATDKS